VHRRFAIVASLLIFLSMATGCSKPPASDETSDNNAPPKTSSGFAIAAMNPESLKLNEGTILIRIMRRKADELNRVSSLVKHGLSSSNFDALCDAALDTFGNGEAPVVKTYSAEGGYGDYSIEIIGVDGAYAVCALEYDDEGMFGTLEEAEGYVALNWFGQAKET
jgi:hypothetical protein